MPLSCALSCALSPSSLSQPPAFSPTPSLQLSLQLSLQTRVAFLNKNGYLIIPDALPPSLISAARSSANDLYASSSSSSSSSSSLFGSQNHSDVRTDRVALISSSTPGLGAPLLAVLRHLRSLPSLLSSFPLYTLTSSHRVPLDCQLAVYDGGQTNQTFYKPHRDNPVLGTGLLDVGLTPYLKARPYKKRGLTAIVYLNGPVWREVDGGALTLYPGASDDDDVGTTCTRPVRVRPDGGTVVLFDSRRVLHGVEECRARRVAVTVWIEGEQ